MPPLTAWNVLRKLMFKMDPESAHRLMVGGVVGLNDVAPFLLERISGMNDSVLPRLQPEVFGMKFMSALGLAAGFDKNAELVSALPHLGFGFCEIGTVTPKAQDGNTKPRLMRDADTQSLFNRMGFNNEGAEQIARNLESHKKKLPANFRVGVNIGKNKNTQGDDIATDYAKAAQPFLDLADFFVINVSSPNTPGLRALQERESLEPIIDAVESVSTKSNRNIPVLVKLAPEVSGDDLAALIEFFESKSLAGLVLTNTLAGQNDIGPGGWSGGRVRDLALSSLIKARAATKMPIISVGGIDSPEIARDRIRKGATLVELYSGWIFKGPQLPPKISSAL